MPPEDTLLLNMLIQSLQLLAAPYEVQVQSLPAFVHIPDEVALTFDDVSLLVEQQDTEGLLPPEQKLQLDQLDHVLDTMSKDTGLWELDALERSAQWEEVRRLAGHILDALHEAKQLWRLFWLQYVPGKKTPEGKDEI
jgi:hypothetical protein